jgi:hypothetical protein
MKRLIVVAVLALIGSCVMTCLLARGQWQASSVRRLRGLLVARCPAGTPRVDVEAVLDAHHLRFHHLLGPGGRTDGVVGDIVLVHPQGLCSAPPRFHVNFDADEKTAAVTVELKR